MFIATLFISAVVVFIAVSRIYARYTFSSVEYSISLSTSEVFEDEDLFLFEEIVNNKTLPLPCVRVDTELPEGLYFRLHKRDEPDEGTPTTVTKRKKRGPVTSRPVHVQKSDTGGAPDSSGEYLRRYVQSIFVLHSYRKIMRRWRIACQKRGTYSISGTMLISTDPLGITTQSKRVEAPSGKRGSVTVLPKPIDMNRFFAASYNPAGDRTAPHGLLSDPLRIAGSREYTPLDPMNKINWLSTVVHGKLMVNVEEFAEQNRFGLILNMQSRSREHDPRTPSDPQSVELCVSVCASIFDMMSYGSVPVRMYVNAPPSDAGLGEESTVMIDGDAIIRTRAFTGRGDMIDALRLLAVLPMKISCPAEKMFDAVIADPQQYTDGGNLVVVSPYLDERMLNFHAVMRKIGVRVVFYITTTNQNAPVIPEDVDVWFKTFR
jgi:hypothetical protein